MTLNVILLILGFLGALAFPLIYGFGARWWTNPIGRMLMGLGAVITLVYSKSLIVIIGGGVVNNSFLSTVINTISAGAVWGMALTIAHVIHTAKKEAA